MQSETSDDSDRRGERQRGELRRAQVPDDRGVDEQVQRLGGQRAERGQREHGRSRGRRPSGARLPDHGSARRPGACLHRHAPSARRPARPRGARGGRGLRGRRPTAARRRVHRVAGRDRARARRARRGPSTLPTGTRLSQCVSHARSDGDLQSAGVGAHARRRRPREPGQARRRGGGGRRSATSSARRGAGAKRTGRDPRRAAAPRRELGAGARRRGAAPVAGALARGMRAGEATRVKLRLFHHRDGARVAYREAGTGPGLVLAALGAPQPPRVGAGRRAPQRPLPARAPRPAAARRLRGPPAPPVHARVARRGDGRVLPRDARARTRSSAATTSARRSCCARSRPAQLEPAKLVLMPNCLHRAAASAPRCAGRGGRRRAWPRSPGSTASSATARGARSGPTSA